ncbi:hypothetical protein AN639_05130 [Candidatus Epulonipiscium fishelsonii]|uniref:Uncharacterized protein n=1 Tax=Candidatus Epulonipiscium fishelsonii TaxID=77094 RepID=A0ACC8XBD5_9FIRM|nr:hypothetical protein AN396_06825 [Epulopiscium sp. SCG-B11WGA-EpuloA1]ONI40268.1 hypothetical protein AN639_05130 [Epulopiscium sp. SCG-B05WGA-EpuloA1]
MIKISPKFDFMRNIVFKLMCMYNEDGHDNEIIVKDLIEAFFSLSGMEIELEDRYIKISEYPFDSVKNIFKKDFKEQKEHSQTIYPDIRIDIGPKDILTMGMQKDSLNTKQTKRTLIVRMAENFVTIVDKTTHDSKNYLKTGEGNTLWLVNQATIAEFTNPVIVGNFTFREIKPNLMSGKSTEITEIGNAVAVCLKSKKLSKYETYNERTAKWLNLFLNKELDETDPVFKEVLKFYNNCMEKGKVSDMLVYESKYAKMMASDIREMEDRLKEEIREEIIQEVREEIIQELMDELMEEGVAQGIEEGIIRVATSLLDILDDETIALKTELSLKEVISLRDNS